MLPKAMAYAVVAGVPPVYGLYASCAAPALAVAFGSNRLLFTGPVGVMTVLVLGSLHHFAESFSPAYIELAASLTLMVGPLILLFPPVRRRPGGLPRPAPPPPGPRGLHRRCRPPHHWHAGRPRAGPAAAVRAFGHPSASLPGGSRRGLVPPRRSRPRPLRRLHRHRAP